MNVHKNARLTPRRRHELVSRIEQGELLTAVARAFDVSRQTASKWLKRKGEAGVVDPGAWTTDRSSRPERMPRQTPPKLQLAAKVLRMQRWTCAQIGGALGVSAATIARILRRCGMSRRGRLTAPVAVERYEHRQPGDLLHLDTKKLGRIGGLGHRITGAGGRLHRHRGIGWEFLHIAIDDHSRVAYVELLPDAHGVTVAAFLRRATSWFRARGVRVRRVLTDNGSGYISRSFRATCRGLHVRPRRIRPYTPRTNGKAERFIQTALREWAYRRPYYSSSDRARMLPMWIEHYNCARPHGSLSAQPPMSRLPMGNNLTLVHT